MNQMGEFLTQYATKEVFTVIGAIVVAAMGWKAAKGTLGFFGGIAKKASFMGLASTLLVITGMGVTGLGVGEFGSRPSESAKQSGLSNDQLVKLLTNEHRVDPDLMKQALDYARERDTQAVKKTEEKAIAFRKEGNKLIPVNYEEPVLRVSNDPFNLKTADDTVVAEESIVSKPIAGMMIGLGLALSSVGSIVYLNRNQRRNTDDPHHPNYDNQYAQSTGYKR